MLVIFRKQQAVGPPRNPHPQATRAFQRVAAAYTVLSDPQKRADYDLELTEGEQRLGFAAGHGPGKTMTSHKIDGIEDRVLNLSFSTYLERSAPRFVNSVELGLCKWLLDDHSCIVLLKFMGWLCAVLCFCFCELFKANPL